MTVKRTTPVARNTEASKRRGEASYPGVISGVSDETFRRFVQDFYALSSGMQEIRRHLAMIASLPHSGYTALTAIDHLQNDNGVTVNDLARYLNLKGSSVTIEVGRLVDSGLVVKQSHANDRRKVLLALTPKGKEIIERTAPVWREINGSVFDVLTVSEFEAFCSVVKRVLEQVEPSLELAKYLCKQSER